MSYCKTCGKHIWNDYHKCPPAFEVLDVDYTGDDWGDAYTVYDSDHEEAARAAAEEMDNGSDGPSERTVIVREKGKTEVKQFSITFDYSVDYYARELPAQNSAVTNPPTGEHCEVPK